MNKNKENKSIFETLTKEEARNFLNEICTKSTREICEKYSLSDSCEIKYRTIARKIAEKPIDYNGLEKYVLSSRCSLGIVLSIASAYDITIPEEEVAKLRDLIRKQYSKDQAARNKKNEKTPKNVAPKEPVKDEKPSDDATFAQLMMLLAMQRKPTDICNITGCSEKEVKLYDAMMRTIVNGNWEDFICSCTINGASLDMGVRVSKFVGVPIPNEIINRINDIYREREEKERLRKEAEEKEREKAASEASPKPVQNDIPKAINAHVNFTPVLEKLDQVVTQINQVGICVTELTTEEDREDRSKAIIKEIQKMDNDICAAIATGFEEMTKCLNSNFDVLTKQVRDDHTGIGTTIRKELARKR